MDLTAVTLLISDFTNGEKPFSIQAWFIIWAHSLVTYV